MLHPNLPHPPPTSPNLAHCSQVLWFRQHDYWRRCLALSEISARPKPDPNLAPQANSFGRAPTLARNQVLRFRQQEYWRLGLSFGQVGSIATLFSADPTALAGAPLGKMDLGSKAAADDAVRILHSASAVHKTYMFCSGHTPAVSTLLPHGGPNLAGQDGPREKIGCRPLPPFTPPFTPQRSPPEPPAPRAGRSPK